MYNRYIPQSDGSFQRSRIPDSAPVLSETKQKSPPPLSNSHPPLSAAPCISQCTAHPPRPKPHPPCREPEKPGSIIKFLKQLFPGDFDVGDLLVILLLLLISGDCQEDQNTALLTLALYLFL